MAEEGTDGLVLPVEGWDRLREDWDDEDIEDALRFVQDSLLQGELVEAADNLSARLVDILGTFGEKAAFELVQAGQARMTAEMLDQLARRVGRLEEILEVFREGAPVDRRGLIELQRRLADLGIEEEMQAAHDEPETLLPGRGHGPDDDN